MTSWSRRSRDVSRTPDSRSAAVTTVSDGTIAAQIGNSTDRRPRLSKSLPDQENHVTTDKTSGRTSRAGTIALVCGIASLPMPLSQYTVWLMPVLGIAAIVIGIYALRRTNSPKRRSKAGLILGTLTTTFSVLIISLVYAGIQMTTISPDEYRRIQSGMSHRQVARIVGSNGQHIPVPGLGSVYDGYRWPGSRRDTGAVVVFVNDKVFTKLNKGLTPAP